MALDTVVCAASRELLGIDILRAGGAFLASLVAPWATPTQTWDDVEWSACGASRQVLLQLRCPEARLLCARYAL